MIEGFLGAEAFRTGVRAYLKRYRERNATADDFWRELRTRIGARRRRRSPTPGSSSPAIRCVTLRAAAAAALRCASRQQRFFADPRRRRATDGALWPIPDGDQVRHRRRRARGARRWSTAPRRRVAARRATWFYPNGDGAGFYRFALDDAALARLVAVRAVGAHRATNASTLVGNQWALVEGRHGRRRAVLRHARRASAARRDRAVLRGDHRAPRTGSSTHVCRRTPRRAGVRALRRRLLSRPHLDALGWDAARRRERPTTACAAPPRSARSASWPATRRRRRGAAPPRCATSRIASSIDPNLASVVVGLAARRGDAALYERYLERKRAAASDPEEEQRFLFGLTAFEDPELVERTLALTLTRRGAPAGSRPPASPACSARARRAPTRVGVRARPLGRRSSTAWIRCCSRTSSAPSRSSRREPAASEVRAFLPPRTHRRDARDDQPDGRAAGDRRRGLPAAHARRRRRRCGSSSERRRCRSRTSDDTWSGWTSRCRGSIRSATRSSRSPP